MIVLGMNVCFVCAYGRAAPLVQFEFALIPFGSKRQFNG